MPYHRVREELRLLLMGVKQLRVDSCMCTLEDFLPIYQRYGFSMLELLKREAFAIQLYKVFQKYFRYKY